MKISAFRLPKISVNWEDEPPPPNNEAALASSDTQMSDNADVASPVAKKKRGLTSIILGLDRPPKPPRSVWARLFSLKIGQFLNLFIWSALIGVVMHLTNFNPLNPQFNATETAGNVWQQGISAIVWAFQASWKPALTGATVILPIWFCCRVITLPFRR